MTSESPKKLTLPVGDRDHSLGPKDAPIVLVEYGNYECVHTRRFHPIVKLRRRRLGDRLRYVFRHLPTPAHPHAQLAAEAAEAAGAQGKFWEMHNYLFNHHHEVLMGEEQLIRCAAEIGLDVERFKRELTEHVYADRVQEDFLSGVESGVNGTPTFFLNEERYDDPWDLYSVVDAVEKPLGVKVRLLGQRFASRVASGSIVLLVCTILALIWANSSWSESYFRLWEIELGLNLGNLLFSEPLFGWVNDALMAVFFLVVGLEIKREFIAGELADPKQATLPLVGALGGMIMPAIIYIAFNFGGPSMPGWGIPMATDIAFTLGVLAILGNRVPVSLKVFFAALAIADDLGAILVIAIFYTSHISWFSLIIGMVFLLMLVGLNRIRVYSAIPYILLGVGLWVALFNSGIHSTIAGVLLAMTIPARGPINIHPLLVQIQSLVDDFELPSKWRVQVASRRQAMVQTLKMITNRLQSPAQNLGQSLSPWVVFLILPIFAFANAGVKLDLRSFLNLINPVSLGIFFGLVFGKPVGITLASWLTIKLGLTALPTDVGWWRFFTANWLAGIGFTMSLFIANAAFFDDPVVLSSAKLAIFMASISAGVIGSLLVSTTNPSFDKAKQMKPATM